MDALLKDALDLWENCPATPPPFERVYTAAEQEAREQGLDRFLEAIQRELHNIPATREARAVARDRINQAFIEFALASLELEPRHLDVLIAGGFSAVGTELGKSARRFDPAVPATDILQASRNAWTACGLQTLLGAPMRLSPSIFAYSMLYPYTDNYLDAPEIPREDKLGFNARFGLRLAGGTVEAANERESAIWRLIAIIEQEHTRTARPEIFEGLLRIHRAQAESVRLLRQGSREPVDVLGLSFEKGGSSVLADGCMASPAPLTGAQERFVFTWGVLLQLADDLQDVQQDCRAGVLTLFSDTATRGPLDALTNRTFHYARAVMARMYGIGDCRELHELMARSASSMFVRAVGEAASLYTTEYVSALEHHSPFRFAFLDERRREFARRGTLVTRLFEAFLEGEDDEPAFPLLPGSLMPRY